MQCLLLGSNPGTPVSCIKHSTTEPPCSLDVIVDMNIHRGYGMRAKWIWIFIEDMNGGHIGYGFQ